MKKIVTLLIALTLSACASTDSTTNTPSPWQISDKQVVVVGCESLKADNPQADC